MTRRGSARADAIRRAHEAKAARDAARQHRETQIESALADYYHAAALAERIRDTARRKYEDLVAEAERTAEPQDAAAAQSVRRLRDLLGGIPETAQLCGLTATAIREMLAARQAGRPWPGSTLGRGTPVNDPQAAPGQEDDSNAGIPRETEHVVTTMLRSDAVILMVARKTVQEGDGSPAAHIAARRDLDREVREFLAWPSGEDYARAAEDYERMGRPDDAALLRGMAATDALIAAAKAEWNTRYEARPSSLAGEMIDAMRQAAMIDFDPAGPYMGVDGAAYEPGALTIGGKSEPVLVITGRGAAEFITDWPGFDAMADWVASRGTTASGPLTPPAAGPDCRAWQEDQVLARLVSSPRDVPQFTAALTPDTFTTDVRYDVYQTIVALADRGGYYTPEQLTAELGMRMASVPAYALVNYGGAAGLFARAYLARLASTEVTSVAAAATALTLVQEDAHHRKRLAQGTEPAPSAASAAGGERRPGQTQVGGLPLQQPPPQPGPGPTVAQRP